MKYIYLRDAGVINEKTNNPYFYKNEFFSRLDNAIKLAKKFKIHLQLTIGKDFFLDNLSSFNQMKPELKKIKFITVHLQANYNSLISNDKKSILFIKKLIKFSNDLKNIVGYCVHPDNVNKYDTLKKLKNKKNYLAIEVTDLKSRSGNNFKQIQKLLNTYQYLDLVLDTSHINDIKQKFIDEPSFNDYCNYFGKRIVEIQISSNENNYKKKIFGKNFKKDHSLLAISKKRISIQLLKMPYFKNLNLVIEGVVPYSAYGKGLLSKEILILKKIIKKNRIN